ncbi:MAG: hydroxymethylglutaryl-CoA reductase, degradative [Candidatus Aenigmarchaeota archaeon]|nr:hydroxymethylglutaryl-CoA reductase, degradative [Candidatus Aenigmarchaeota archaeon]
MNSAIPRFYEMPLDRRLKTVQEFSGLDDNEIALLKQECALDNSIAEIMIENVIGTTHLPVGIATYFLINDKDYLIPMAIEEPSVVAAASHAAKLARLSGGFKAKSTTPVMTGQVQIKNVHDFDIAEETILKSIDSIKALANKQDSTLVKRGGGLVSAECRKLETERGDMLVVHLNIDVRDAMGANAVNTMCESVAPYLEELTGGIASMKIISNLAAQRLVTAEAVWKKNELGEELIEGILDAYAFAKADPYRAATNNKGIMNGIDAVLIAAGNDFRAVESGAHSYACMSGRYQPLAHYRKNENGDLVGRIELPMAVGIVGGATKTNPIARIALKILGVRSANELGEISACAGLANNFAAVRAIVKEGIQHGHMKLHAKNIAIIAGAQGDKVHQLAERMIREKMVSVSRAEELLKEMGH